MAFLAETERRSGSRRTVEGYAQMLWPFLGGIGSADRVTPAHVLAWAHGIGLRAPIRHGSSSDSGEALQADPRHGSLKMSSIVRSTP